MKKENFINLIIGVIGGLFFSLGMCMCLLPEWNAFKPGMLCIAAGILLLGALLARHFRTNGMPAIRIRPRTLGAIALGTAGALIMGTGMCMIMVWNIMIPGILVGIAGIILLLCLIPLCIGLK